MVKIMKIKCVFNRILKTLYVDDIKCIYCNKELDENKKYGLCEKCENLLPYNKEKYCK